MCVGSSEVVKELTAGRFFLLAPISVETGRNIVFLAGLYGKGILQRMTARKKAQDVRFAGLRGNLTTALICELTFLLIFSCFRRLLR